MKFKVTDRIVDERHRRLSEYIREKQLKVTRQRTDIADAFFRTNSHLSIEELLELARRKNKRVGYATVYRTLKLLTEAGLANERYFGDKVARYEVNERDEHHDHMVCLSCGKIIEFENDDIEKLQAASARAQGFRLVRHRLELYGICRDCQTVGKGMQYLSEH
ncbi:MAG: transcriptional repressor [Deltaproteobacteria bacterium]|nr:transcriptional repressor [Deltaproteobacteria bacterium]